MTAHETCEHGVDIYEYCDQCETQEERDEQEARALRITNLASLKFGQVVVTKRNGGIMGGMEVAARRVGLIAALALALIPLTTSATPAYPDSLTPPPTGCVVTHWTPDDFSAQAVCAGGYLVTKEDGPRGAWDDIPYAVGTTRVGPDANGAYWDWPIWD